MFNKKEIIKILSSKEIYLSGRGPSTKYMKLNKKGVCYIGYRIKIKDCIYLNNDRINKSKYKLKVGSINFGLYTVLKELELLNIKKKTKIFLFGFDFRKYSTDDDYNKKIIYKPMIQQITDVGTQSFTFEIIKKSFKKLNIYRCGFDFYSDVNPKNMSTNYKNRNKNLEIVAEITTNHHGSTQRLSKLIEGAVEANCKIIKFSKRDVDNFYSKKVLNRKYQTPISNNFYEYRKKLELNNEQLDLIKYYKKKCDLEVIFSALDVKSYEELKIAGFNYFKIPSTISLHKKFINYLSTQKIKKIVVSTGMSDKKYVKFIINKFKFVDKLYLLHAISSYPTSYNYLNIEIIKLYEKLSQENKFIIPGYSSHEPGSLGCIMAVAAGARMIEKHIKIGESDWLHYDDTALDVNYEFPLFVEDVSRSFSSLGTKKKKILNIEHHKYAFIEK